MRLTPHPYLECRGPRKIRAVPLLTLRAFVAYKKGENLLTTAREETLLVSSYKTGDKTVSSERRIISNALI